MKPKLTTRPTTDADSPEQLIKDLLAYVSKVRHCRYARADAEAWWKYFKKRAQELFHKNHT